MLGKSAIISALMVLLTGTVLYEVQVLNIVNQNLLPFRAQVTQCTVEESDEGYFYAPDGFGYGGADCVEAPPGMDLRHRDVVHWRWDCSPPDEHNYAEGYWYATEGARSSEDNPPDGCYDDSTCTAAFTKSEAKAYCDWLVSGGRCGDNYQNFWEDCDPSDPGTEHCSDNCLRQEYVCCDPTFHCVEAPEIESEYWLISDGSNCVEITYPHDVKGNVEYQMYYQELDACFGSLPGESSAAIDTLGTCGAPNVCYNPPPNTCTECMELGSFNCDDSDVAFQNCLQTHCGFTPGKLELVMDWGWSYYMPVTDYEISCEKSCADLHGCYVDAGGPYSVFCQDQAGAAPNDYATEQFWSGSVPDWYMCVDTCDLPCGNGQPDIGEECDLGVSNSDTGACTTDCKDATCGDSHIWSGNEECDNGSALNVDSGDCTSECKHNVCGDGNKHNLDEECDEGDSNSDTGVCTPECTDNICGDGYHHTGVEECDNGSANNRVDQACTPECKQNVCGDGGKHNGVEECDEGANNSDNGVCTSVCTNNVCGDGFTHTGVEECDEGASNSDDGSCTSDCKNATCGDGVTRTDITDPAIAGYEACDQGANNSDNGVCTSICTTNVCGDGFTHTGVEECDDGNTDPADECANDCTFTFCGDGIVQSPNGENPPFGVHESCETDTDCDRTGECIDCVCRPRCGNGKLDAGETCDIDGSSPHYAPGCRDTSSDDPCTYCGDGNPDTDSGEVCDDGNDIETDSCTTSCEAPMCGDTFVRTDITDTTALEYEECDIGFVDYDPEEPVDCLGCKEQKCPTDDPAVFTSAIYRCHVGCITPTFISTDPSDPQCSSGSCPSGTTAVAGDATNSWVPGEACSTFGIPSITPSRYCCLSDAQIQAGISCCALGSTCSIECPTCGNSIREYGESCDHGGESATCNADCTHAVCPDSIVNTTAGEECDDGNWADGDGCSSTCQLETIVVSSAASSLQSSNSSTISTSSVSTSSVASSSSTISTTSSQNSQRSASSSHSRSSHTSSLTSHFSSLTSSQASLSSQLSSLNSVSSQSSYSSQSSTVCGDSIVQPPEECDDGNSNNNDGCTNACKWAICGDEIVRHGEGCDDGNSDNTDGCLNDCTVAACGDGIVRTDVTDPTKEGYEECDPDVPYWIDPTVCGNDCKKILCPDGYPAIRECSDACVEPSYCSWEISNPPEQCPQTIPACSPGEVEVSSGDRCTHVMIANAKTCPGLQSNSTCCMTQDQIDSGMECCRSVDCQPFCGSRCGDGTIDDDEDCDDAGETASCDVDCTNVLCGDNTMNTTAGEECDDGNTQSGDGCSALCQNEHTTSSQSSNSSTTSSITSRSSTISTTSSDASHSSVSTTSSVASNSSIGSRGSSSSQSSQNSASSSHSRSSHTSSLTSHFSSLTSQTSLSSQISALSSSLSSSSSSAFSIPPGHHAACSTKQQCEIVPGIGINECTIDADCLHTTCLNDQCVVVSGPGFDECITSGHCTPDQHLECIQGACIPVPGAGQNLCLSSGDCCFQEGTCQPSFHTECIDDQCVSLPGPGNDQCSNTITCNSTQQHTECQNSQCVLVDTPGINECIDDEQCTTPQSHTTCQNGACIVVQGSGTNECLDNAQCKPGQHLTCHQNQCVVIPGFGTNTCTRDVDCAPGDIHRSSTRESHMECIGLQCVMVNGSGKNECINDSHCFTSNSHLECKNQQCITVAGGGKNECINDTDCGNIPLGGHLECQNEQCIPIAGSGRNECINDSDCISRIVPHGECENGACVQKVTPGFSECINNDDCIPPSAHLECQNNQCQVVSGPGINECINDSDCTGNQHTECQGGMCIPVQGSGINECTNDDDCTRTLRGYTQCQAQQCISIEGSGSNQCVNNSDCALHRTEHTICADLQCIVVPGNGTNQCLNHDDCIIATHGTQVAASQICGDGILQFPEECDDGNARDFDGCSAYCTLEVGICGDGIIQKNIGEQCEPSLHNPQLPYLCHNCRFHSPTCGDNTKDPGEECDRGADNSDAPDSPCRADCSLQRCGDGIKDTIEECDDGNTLNTDTCSSNCTITLRTAAPLTAHIGFQTPQSPNYQPLPYQIPLQQYATPVPYGDTGPGAIAVIAIGSGLGYAYVRRRKKSER